MNEQKLTHITAPTRPLHQLITPPFEEEAIRVMLKHGCRLKEIPNRCVILFPEGTTKTEIFLRTRNPRYRITLLDGYELYESYDRYRKISILSYPPE